MHNQGTNRITHRSTEKFTITPRLLIELKLKSSFFPSTLMIHFIKLFPLFHDSFNWITLLNCRYLFYLFFFFFFLNRKKLIFIKIPIMI